MSINDLLSTPEGKEALKSDKTRLADALALSVLGVTSLLKIDSENSAARKLKEEMKGSPVPGEVKDGGSWVRNIINLSLEAGLIDRTTASSMLGMVSGFKKRPTSAVSMNPAIFRNAMHRPDKLRVSLSPKVRAIWDKVTKDAGTFDGFAISKAALDIYAISKQKEYSDITADFKEAVSRGGYVSKFGLVRKKQEEAEKAIADQEAENNSPGEQARREEIRKAIEEVRAKREAEKARRKVKNTPAAAPVRAEDDSFDSEEAVGQAYVAAVKSGDLKRLIALVNEIFRYSPSLRADRYREIRKADGELSGTIEGRARSNAALSYMLTQGDDKLRQAALAIVEPKEYLDRFALDRVLAEKKPTNDQKNLISLIISQISEFYPITIDRDKATRLFMSFVEFYDKVHRKASGLPEQARNEVVKVLKLLAPNTNLTKEEIADYFAKVSMSNVDLAIKKFSDNLPNIAKWDWIEAVKTAGKAGFMAANAISQLRGADREKVADNLTREIFEPDTGYQNLDVYYRCLERGSRIPNTLAVVPTPWLGLLTDPKSTASKIWWNIVDTAAGQNLQNFDETVVPALNKLFELGKKVSLDQFITFLELSNYTGRLDDDLYERVMEQWSSFRREALQKVAGKVRQEEEPRRRM